MTIFVIIPIKIVESHVYREVDDIYLRLGSIPGRGPLRSRGLLTCSVTDGDGEENWEAQSGYSQFRNLSEED